MDDVGSVDEAHNSHRDTVAASKGQEAMLNPTQLSSVVAVEGKNLRNVMTEAVDLPLQTCPLPLWWRVIARGSPLLHGPQNLRSHGRVKVEHPKSHGSNNNKLGGWTTEGRMTAMAAGGRGGEGTGHVAMRIATRRGVGSTVNILGRKIVDLEGRRGNTPLQQTAIRGEIPGVIVASLLEVIKTSDAAPKATIGEAPGTMRGTMAEVKEGGKRIMDAGTAIDASTGDGVLQLAAPHVRHTFTACTCFSIFHGRLHVLLNEGMLL